MAGKKAVRKKPSPIKLLFAILALIAVGMLLLYLNGVKREFGTSDASEISLKSVRDSGELRVLTSLGVYPWAAYDAKTGHESGGEIEIARKIAEELGVTAVFIDSDELLTDLEAKKGDVIIYRSGRDGYDEAKFRTTVEYFSTGLALVVPSGSAVAGLADLAGKRVGVAVDNCCPDAATVALTSGGTPVLFKGEAATDEGLRAVLAGTIDAGIFEMAYASWFARASSGKLTLVGGDAKRFVTSGSPYVVIVRTDDDSLRGELDRVITKLMGSGALSEIINRWYLTP